MMNTEKRKYSAFETLRVFKSLPHGGAGGGFFSKNQIAYDKNKKNMNVQPGETFKGFGNLEGLANRNLFGRETTQKPIHPFPHSGDAQQDVFPKLPSFDGGVGGGLRLIHKRVSIKPLTGPAPATFLTSKKTHLYFGGLQRLTKAEVQTIY